MNLLIYNVLIITNNDDDNILRGHAIAIEDTRIKEVGPESQLRTAYRHFRELDGGGRLLMPGLINAHMHFYGTFARGLALRKAPKNFADILSELWWKLDSALDSEAVYYSTLIPAISAIKHGVTAVIDHHASPNAVDGSLDRIEEAMNHVGLRGVLCYEISDRDGADIRTKGLEENARYIAKCASAKEQNPDSLFDGMVGLHASFTLDDSTLRQAADLSRSSGRGCHIHLLEDAVDRTATLEKYDQGVVERLVDYGILGNKTIAAHGIHLADSELGLLAESRSMVVHNPQSNMNNAVGRADIFKLLQAGILVGIGTDGMSPDLKPDVRTGYLLHKHDLRNPNAAWGEIQKMTLKNNVEIFERVSGQKLGRIEAGCLADLILVDYFSPTPLTSENFWGHFLFGITDAVVDTTIINGKVVMASKQVVGVEETRISHDAQRCAERVWQRFGT